jgi:hypothetical protein
MEYDSRGPSQGRNEWGRREKRLKRGGSQRKTGDPEKRSGHVRDRVCDGVQNIELVTGRKWGACGTGKESIKKAEKCWMQIARPFSSKRKENIRVFA